MWNWTATARLFLDDQELAFGAVLPPSDLDPAAPGPRRPLRVRVPLEGGRQYGLRVEYRQPGAGGTLQLGWIPPARAALAEAEALAKDSDVAIVFVGLSSELEGEEMRGVNIPGFLGGDRTSLDLPEPQENLVKAMIATGKPVVVVLTSGSAVAVRSAAERASAVLAAWYGGEEAGTAIAETLAGVNNPAGRLPVTFYQGVDQLPPFTDYAMKGRTYRYFKGEPLYPFGFGLSYSTFAYSGLLATTDGEGRRDPRHGQEHLGPGRRRGRSALRRRWPRGGSAGPKPARVPADPPAGGREPRGDLHARHRRPAEVRGGGQRRRRAAARRHTARAGLVVGQGVSREVRRWPDGHRRRVAPRPRSRSP